MTAQSGHLAREMIGQAVTGVDDPAHGAVDGELRCQIGAAIDSKLAPIIGSLAPTITEVAVERTICAISEALEAEVQS